MLSAAVSLLVRPRLPEVLWRLLPALILLLLPPTPAMAQPTDTRVGVVVKVSGVATAVRNGATLALTLGDPILVGDTLETGPDSALGVTLLDNSLFSLGPQSTFELTDFMLDPIAGVFSMGGRITNGSMVITTGEIGEIAPDNVSFETPFGIIGIRGTKLAIRVS